MSAESTSVPDLFSTTGLVAVVTGGGTGIGRMVATALENNGATVYIVGRRLEPLEKSATECNKHGNIIPLQCDIASRESLLTLVETIKTRHGFINLLVNNAAVSQGHLRPPASQPGSIADLQSRLWNSGTHEDFAKIFEVNVTAAYYSSVAFLELLHAGNEKGNLIGVTSQIITVSSVAAFRRDEAQFCLPYTLSKAAVTHLGKVLCNLLKDHQIRSNVIAPGFYPSEMTAGLDVDETKMCPLGRTGHSEDMAGIILFLASRAGAYVNGCVHLTDGGRLAQFPSTY